MDCNQVIGRNIRYMRTLRGFTLAELADRMVDAGWNAISNSMVGRWERGEVSIPADALMTIAHALQCTVYSLYFIDRGDVDMDTRLLDEIKSLPEHEKQVLLWIATEWNGDNHALIEFAGLYAAMPVRSREYVARIGIEEYVYEKECGGTCNRVDIDLAKIQRGWEKLDREKGDDECQDII